MRYKEAFPGLAAGALGMCAGLIGLGINSTSFGIIAGLLALVAGFAGINLAQKLSEQSSIQKLVEDELRNVHNEAQATKNELSSRATDLNDDSDETFQAKQDSEPAQDAADRETTETTGTTETASDLEDGEVVSDLGQGEDFDQNSLLHPAADPTALLDEETGLFSENFFKAALESRVAAARRHLRPVALILLEVVEGVQQDEPTPTPAADVAEAITSTLREADTACRLSDGYFALLLEDTPENGAIWTVERIRRFLNDKDPDLTMWAGVACYPAHAFGPDEIVSAARDALEMASEWHQDRIEVAVGAPD